MAADPDRNRGFCTGLGRKIKLEKLTNLPLNARLIAGPEFAERADIFVGDPAALGVIRRLEIFEFFFHPTDADADDHPAAGKHIQTRQHLGGHDGIAVGQDHHAGDEANPLGRAGEKTHGHQSFQMVTRAGIFAVDRVRIRHRDIGRHDHVVGDREQ